MYVVAKIIDNQKMYVSAKAGDLYISDINKAMLFRNTKGFLVEGEFYEEI